MTLNRKLKRDSIDMPILLEPCLRFSSMSGQFKLSWWRNIIFFLRCATYLMAIVKQRTSNFRGRIIQCYWRKKYGKGLMICVAEKRETIKKRNASVLTCQMGRGYLFLTGGFQIPDCMIDEYPTDCQRDKLFWKCRPESKLSSKRPLEFVLV